MDQNQVGPRRRVVPSPKAAPNLAVQYGGSSSAGWVSRFPSSWTPYIQLARLSPPAGLCLICRPGEIGAASLWMLLGSAFVSNAIHIWNDLIDAPLDAQVKRTQHRPTPRGAIIPSEAFVSTATQAIGAALLLVTVPGPLLRSVQYAAPTAAGWAYYPWAKRHTHYPQAVLGLCLAWGTLVGSLAVGHEIMHPAPDGGWGSRVVVGLGCLMVACTLWTMIYDTIYSHQDLEDDMKVGIKSLAVLYREHTKPVLSAFLAGMAILLVASGRLGGTSWIYQCIASCGATLSLAVMIIRVDLSDTSSCWWWFGNGFWYAGGSIASGLIAEYAYQRYLEWA